MRLLKNSSRNIVISQNQSEAQIEIIKEDEPELEPEL
jgi:hypothetical protein